MTPRGSARFRAVRLRAPIVWPFSLKTKGISLIEDLGFLFGVPFFREVAFFF